MNQKPRTKNSSPPDEQAHYVVDTIGTYYKS
jgi:hypothetical protein